MVSNINNQVQDTSSCKSFDGGADKYVSNQVAMKGWPSGQMSGGRRRNNKSTSRGRSRRHNKSSKKTRSCGCIGGSGSKRGKKGGFIAMLGQAIIPFSILAAQKKTQKRDLHRNKSYKKKYSSKRR